MPHNISGNVTTQSGYIFPSSATRSIAKANKQPKKYAQSIDFNQCTPVSKIFGFPLFQVGKAWFIEFSTVSLFSLQEIQITLLVVGSNSNLHGSLKNHVDCRSWWIYTHIERVSTVWISKKSYFLKNNLSEYFIFPAEVIYCF